VFFEHKIPVEKLSKFFTPFIALLKQSKGNCLFQHDGATDDAANTSAPFLLDFFGDRIVGRGLWPS